MLYFHIPFCTRKCDYCHFFVLPNKKDLHNQLMRALRLEWKMRLPQITGTSVPSIYFGGGTPDLIGPENIASIIDWASPFIKAGAEITLEVNPENVTELLMRDFKQAGVNRISLGVQSLDEGQLGLLTRTHSVQRAIEAIEATAMAGIENISIDLMYDLPGQTLASWKKTVNRAATLPITHLSLYNLTFEPQTVFYKKRDILKKTLPTDEEGAEMYRSCVEILREKGLMHYEISAFSKEGFQAQHNLGYWKGIPFLGFGPSAFSYWDGTRFQNTANLNQYEKALIQGKEPLGFCEKLDTAASFKERLAIELRILSGVDMSKYWPILPETKETLRRLTESGFLEESDSALRLTWKGVLFYDSVATEII